MTDKLFLCDFPEEKAVSWFLHCALCLPLAGTALRALSSDSSPVSCWCSYPITISNVGMLLAQFWAFFPFLG